MKTTKTHVERAIERFKQLIDRSFYTLNSDNTGYKDPIQVILAFKPKQLLSFLMVGYRAYDKRRQGKNSPKSKVYQANQKLKSLTKAEQAELKRKILRRS